MTSPKQLGEKIKEVRELRGKSLHAVASEADMSAAYLQKLERGDVKAPSPHKLHSLARALKVPYVGLMRLAGYVVPKKSGGTDDGASVLAAALNSEDLNEEELEALARYLAWYRHEKSTGTAS